MTSLREGAADVLTSFSREHFAKVLAEAAPRALSRMELELISLEASYLGEAAARCRSPLDDDVLVAILRRLDELDYIKHWSLGATHPHR